MMSAARLASLAVGDQHWLISAAATVACVCAGVVVGVGVLRSSFIPDLEKERVFTVFCILLVVPQPLHR
jgi:hypothetical protein